MGRKSGFGVSVEYEIASYLCEIARFGKTCKRIRTIIKGKFEILKNLMVDFD
ncbi:hypothetical protein D3C72_2266760 [compost metagenome]